MLFRDIRRSCKQFPSKCTPSPYKTFFIFFPRIKLK